MAYCYILYSESADKFYIGITTESTDIRLQKHLSDFYSKKKFTDIASDWIVYWSIDCPSVLIARKIEQHIKKMKSRKYYKDLKQFPDIGHKLILRYS